MKIYVLVLRNNSFVAAFQKHDDAVEAGKRVWPDATVGYEFLKSHYHTESRGKTEKVTFRRFNTRKGKSELVGWITHEEVL